MCLSEKTTIIEGTPQNLRITNVFCKADLGCTVDLRKITRKIWNAEDHKSRPYITIEIRNPSSNIMLYHSGKIVVYGVRSESAGRSVITKFIRKLQKIDSGCNITMKKFRVKNMIGDYQFHFQPYINIGHLFEEIASNFDAEYELDSNVLHFTHKSQTSKAKMTVSVWRDGSLRIAGGKSLRGMNEAFEFVRNALAAYEHSQLLRGFFGHTVNPEFIQSMDLSPICLV